MTFCAVAEVAAHERDVRLAVDAALVGVDRERPVLGRQRGVGDALDEALRAHPIADEIRDRDHQQAVLARELRELRHARHRAVLVHDLADHAGGRQPGDARQIDRRLGVPGAHEHAAGRARSGNTWPGRARSRGVVLGAIAARIVCARSAAEMPGGRAVLRVDRHAERRLATRGVVARPRAESRARRAARASSPGRRARGRACAMKLIASGVTFDAAIVRSPSFSRSSSSTTMIMRPARMASMRLPRPVRTATAGDCPWRQAQAIEIISVRARASVRRPARTLRSSSSRATYLPSTSASRLTRSPTRALPSVVCAQRERHDLQRRPGPAASDAIVRLMPSTAIEPFGNHVRARAAPGTSTSSQ